MDQRSAAPIDVTDAKRRVLDLLKRADGLTPAELAGTLGLTESALRMHLDSLSASGLVEGIERAARGRGRPPTEWRLTELARELFPDRHADLTVELIAAIRDASGERGLDRVIESRMRQQLATYRNVVPPTATVGKRVAALARQRSAEGYMADSQRDGRAYVLVEHHCPVCDAATACQGLCRGELELFQSALGDDVTVERTQHLLSGDARCAYRVTPRG